MSIFIYPEELLFVLSVLFETVLSASLVSPIRIAAIMKVDTSISIAASTPDLAIMKPAAPLPASEAALVNTELRLIPAFISSRFITCAVNAVPAGRLKDSTVVIINVKQDRISGLT